MKSKKPKMIKKVFLIIICIFILFLLSTFIINKILLAKEKKMLIEAGYYNPVSVGDYSLNVYDFGEVDMEYVSLTDLLVKLDGLALIAKNF